MGMIELKKGQILHSLGEGVKEMEILLKGKIRVYDSFGQVVLTNGAIVGMSESPQGNYSHGYMAEADSTLYSYPYGSEDDMAKALRLNKKIVPVLVSASVKSALELYGWYENFFNDCLNRYNDILVNYENYIKNSRKLKLPFDPHQEIAELLPPEERGDISSWKLDYINSLAEQDESLKKSFYPLSSEICVGISLQMMEFMQQVSGLIGSLKNYRESLEDAVDSFYADYNSVENKLKAAEAGKEVKEEYKIKGALETILSYSGVSDDIAENFKSLIEEYKKAPDKLDTSDELRALRRDISKLFYVIYAAVFRNSLVDKELSPEVMMFLFFGFMDEELAGHENTAELYSIIKSWERDPNERVFALPEWLARIYEMKDNPSKNEFDTDYIEYVHEQVRNGAVTKEESRKLLEDRERRLDFEIENLFTLGNRLTFGRITTFLPIFTKESATHSLRETFLSADKVNEAFDRVRKVDFSCFYRDTMTSLEEYGVNSFISSKEVLPYVILMPNVGLRTSMWQEIDGRRRDTHSRMLFSIFYTENLEDAVLRLCGEFRWEMCKRIQGVHWNDVTDPSLTAEYSDYLQFYRKNHELSVDGREKIKTALKKARNNFRTVFVADYCTYIRYESNGSSRLNGVARGILFRYCPFDAAIRNVIMNNPLYKKHLETYKLKMSQKVKIVNNVVQRIINLREEVPDVVRKQLNYLRM
ncbi:MAG: hypothetical protein J6O55_01490 [Lachnospiraceae bacterium]|nr:hypothetical protein [Lachnospiraceae bacterium]